MKRLLTLMILLICANAQAQWLNGAGWLQHENHSDGRAHPGERSLKSTRVEILSEPSSIPNWPFPNVNVTNFPDTDQTEPSIAINPLDSMNIVIAANDDRNFDRLWVYTSTDGGATWTDQPLPKGADWVNDAFDPSVAFNKFGFAFIMNGELDDNTDRNDVEVFRSTDKGTNWERWGMPFMDSLEFDSIADKYYLAIDNTKFSFTPNRMYAAWAQKGFADTATRIAESSSSDSGKTWSPVTFATNMGIYTSPIPAVGEDGAPNFVMEDHQIGKEKIEAINQNDAPLTIGNYIDLGPVEPFDASGNPTNNGYPCINGDVSGPLMVNSFPSMACDPVSFHERTYVVWCAKGVDEVPHLWYAYSDGIPPSWSTPVAIETDSIPNAISRFFPWVATDPVTGNVAVAYYVATKTSGMNPNITADLYMAFSTDYGANWATRKISDVPSFAATGRDTRFDSLKFFGDYINLAGYNNSWHPAWCDGRNAGDLEIYTATVQTFAPMPVTNLTAHDTIVNGKHATVVSWSYDPQTTFGYPLPAGYFFVIAKDGHVLTRLHEPQRSFIDTLEGGNEYEVTVIPATTDPNKFPSITDSIPLVKSGIANMEWPQSSIRFSRMPLRAGSATALSIQLSEPCSIAIDFYDETGNRIQFSTEDIAVSNQHRFSIEFPTPGIRFYVVKEIFAQKITEMPGKIAVMP